MVRRVLLVLSMLLLAGCNIDETATAQPSPLTATTIVPSTATLTPVPAPTFTLAPTATLRPPTPTALPPTSTATLMPPSPTATLSPTATAVPATATPQPEIRFTLAAVGDLLLHYNIIDTAEAHGYDYLFDAVRPYIHTADFAYANHEGPSDSATPPSGVFPTFNYSPKLDIAAKKAGFGIVSTANNHALDRGASGLDHTIASLDAAGLLHHGTTARGSDRLPYQPFDFAPKNGVGLRGAFISATYGTNGAPDPYNQVNTLWDNTGHVRQGLKDDITLARRESDLVVVAAHWGTEYQVTPEAQQVQGAQEMADAGADIILGDHPHTIQPVDTITAKDGRTVFVIYSLGNFIAAQQRYQAESFTQTSVILYITVAKTGNAHARFVSYSYLPVYIEYDTRPVPNLGNTYLAARQHVMQQMKDLDGKFIFNLNT